MASPAHGGKGVASSLGALPRSRSLYLVDEWHIWPYIRLSYWLARPGGNEAASPATAASGEGMHITRRFTTAGQDPYATVPFRTATSEIRNPDGSLVFQAEGIEVPAEWSQVACDILAQKYFRKAGVPARLAPVVEEGVPSWLWCHAADKAAPATLPEAERYGGETSARQVFDRMAGTWTYRGWKGRNFNTEEVHHLEIALNALDLASRQLRSGIVSPIVRGCTCSKSAARFLLQVVAPRNASATALPLKVSGSRLTRAAATMISSVRQPVRRPVGSPDHLVSNSGPPARLGGIGESASAIGTSSAQPRSATEPPIGQSIQCESGNFRDRLNRKRLSLRGLARKGSGCCSGRHKISPQPRPIIPLTSHERRDWGSVHFRCPEPQAAATGGRHQKFQTDAPPRRPFVKLWAVRVAL